MKIVLDCMGCDDPEAVVRGAAAALRAEEEVSLILAGPEERIGRALEGEEFDRDRLEIADARETIVNGEPPVAAVRAKPGSSLCTAFRILRDRGDAAAMISAGSTGAVLAGGIFILGRSEGTERPALASLLPTDPGGSVCLTDCGANADCRPEHLLQFAEHAAAYVRCFLGIPAPRTALLSVGAEEGKGNELTKKAFSLLKQSGLNFIGNIEAGAVLSGAADVVVTDGFSGNILLKNMEGTAKSVMRRAAALLKKHAPSGTDTAFIGKAFGELARSVDFNAGGAAVLLGVRKLVLKAHGAAVEETVVNTVRQAVRTVRGGFQQI